MLSMRWPAVEQLIALGADIGGDKRGSGACLSGRSRDAPMQAVPRMAQSPLWMSKMSYLCHIQAAPEAVHDSLFGLIHLAVRWGAPVPFFH